MLQTAGKHPLQLRALVIAAASLSITGAYTVNDPLRVYGASRMKVLDTTFLQVIPGSLSRVPGRTAGY